MKRSILVVMLFLISVVIAGPAFAKDKPKAEGKSVYSFTMQTIDGKNQKLSKYKGKTLLIVNTASRCGYTPQYAGLEELYQKYKAKGFEVLAFPANNFKSQEPGTNDEIKSFCLLNYKTTFPLFAKISVAGADIHPLYQYLTSGSGFDGPISWNFNKFLVSPDGKVVARFDSKVKPLDPQLVGVLEQSLPSKK